MASVLSRSILALRHDDLSNVQRLLPFVSTATRRTTQRLLVILFSDAFDDDDTNSSRAASWDAVQAALTAVYVESARIAYEEDRILMEVDVLLRGTHTVVPQLRQDAWDTVFRLHEGEHILDHVFVIISLILSQDDLDLLLPPRISALQRIDLQTDDPASISAPPSRNLGTSSFETPPSFPVVALGGTFDHLHSGHKILLSMAAWIATEKVIVGVTGKFPHPPSHSPTTHFWQPT